MKDIMRKYVLPCLLVMGCLSTVSAEVLISANGAEVTIENKTLKKQGIVGVRFDSQSDFNGFNSWRYLRMNKDSLEGLQVYDIFATKSWEVVDIDVSSGQTFSGAVKVTVWDDIIDPKKYLEPLYSLGVCDESTPIAKAPGLSISDLKTELESADYYRASYRYDKPDGLGTLGGKHSAGLFDTYFGETQMQLAIPTKTIPYTDSSAAFWIDSTIATMTFMTLTMGQELFAIDQQLMLSLGAQESFLGSSEHFQHNSNENFYHGPWKVSGSTSAINAVSYPNLYPYDSCLLGAIDALGAKTSCAWDNYNDFNLEYMDEAGITPLDHPKVISAWLTGAATWWFHYDLLMGSTDLGFKNVLEESKDHWVGICALAPLHNIGMNSGAEAILKVAKKGSSSVINCADFPIGYSGFRNGVVHTASRFEDAALEVQSDTSANNSQILERWINLNDVQEFYFGRGADSVQPWLTDGATQNGGLMKHFNIGEASKELMWKEIVTAFNLQAAHWGGSKISLRYDWLANLRVAKKYLGLERGPIQSEEGYLWIGTRSGIYGGIDGDILPADNQFPFLHFDSLLSHNDSSKTINISTTDNRFDDRGIAKVEWTIQQDWTGFNSENIASTTNDPKNQSFEINFSAQQLSVMKKDTANPNLYVRAIDSCGNAVVTKVPNFLKDQTVSTLKGADKVKKLSLDEEKPFDVYDSKGVLLGNFHSIYEPRFQNIQMGSYIIVQEDVSIKWIQP